MPRQNILYNLGYQKHAVAAEQLHTVRSFYIRYSFFMVALRTYLSRVEIMQKTNQTFFKKVFGGPCSFPNLCLSELTLNCRPPSHNKAGGSRQLVVLAN